MTDVMDFLDDDAFENCHSFDPLPHNYHYQQQTIPPVVVTIPESPGSSLKKSKTKSSSSSKSKSSSSSSSTANVVSSTPSGIPSTNAAAASSSSVISQGSNSNSLERPKKKKEKTKDHDHHHHSSSQLPTSNSNTDFNMDAYAISLDILGSGEMENSARWVNKNQKKLAELFSMPIDSISIASPNDQDMLINSLTNPSPVSSTPTTTTTITNTSNTAAANVSSSNTLTSPKKSSTIKKETVKSETEVVSDGGSVEHSKSSKSSKSKSSSSSSKKSHKSSSSTEITPTQASQIVQNSPHHHHHLQQQSFTPLSQVSYLTVPLTSGGNSNSMSSSASVSSTSSVKSVSDEEIESKRQFHLACEQTRRKHIKDGLEELKNSLPSCDNQKMTKAAILSKAISYVQHSKRQKDYLTAQINILRQENQYLKASCQCQNHGQNMDGSFNFIPTLSNSAFLKQQEKLQEYTPIQPKVSSQPKNIRPHSTFVQPQLNQTEPPPPYSLPRHSNLLNVPDMRFRNPPSPASSVDGDSDTRSWADETEALPPGWEEIMTPDGKLFYVNKKAGLSSWVDPRLNNAINIQSQTTTSKQHKRTPSSGVPTQGNANTTFQNVHNGPNGQQYVDPLAVPVSPQWNHSSLPDFMLPDLSAIQFEQSVDSDMSDIKQRNGLGVDINQCFAN